MTSCDLAIVGLGALGSAALLAAARAGIDAIGIDRFSPPHTLGSTHGETRIVRAAIGEGVAYTPLALRSLALWDELQAETGRRLVTRCGALVLGGVLPHAMHARADFLETTMAAAQAYGIPHEILSAADVRARFPAFAAFDGPSAYFEPGAGMADPEQVVAAQLDRAVALGARVWTGRRVAELRQTGSAVRVALTEGELEARRVLVAAGPWIHEFLPPPRRADIRVLRQTMHWFAVPPHARPAHAPHAMPVFIWNDLYGFPLADSAQDALKVATEDMEAAASPETVDRTVSEPDVAPVAARLRTMFPQLGQPVRGAVCLYTATPDANFRIGRHPEMDRVTLATACSGHGFKHSAALGEALVTAPEKLAKWRWPQGV